MARKFSREDLDNATQFTQFAPVYKVDSHTVVKSGDIVRMAEAETMKFVRASTTIPVPEVHNSYVDDETGHVVIVMDFVEGENLDKAWDKLGSEDRESVINQLRGYMEQLRQFKGSFIGSVDGTWCNDQFFTEDLGQYGPYETEDDFNQGIVRAMKKDHPYTYVDWICDVWVDVMTGHDIVLTHGDLDPRNILVQGSEVVAILDWEFAGYYPEYWEYCKALRHPEWEGSWIASRALDKILEPYFKEVSVMWNSKEVLF